MEKIEIKGRLAVRTMLEMLSSGIGNRIDHLIDDGRASHLSPWIYNEKSPAENTPLLLSASNFLTESELLVASWRMNPENYNAEMKVLIGDGNEVLNVRREVWQKTDAIQESEFYLLWSACNMREVILLGSQNSDSLDLTFLSKQEGLPIRGYTYYSPSFGQIGNFIHIQGKIEKSRREELFLYLNKPDRISSNLKFGGYRLK
ncbi:MAG: hypothetical protein AABX07_01465 [Nanoarchaeota archaeon]